MTEMLCLLPKPTMAIECLCFDQKTCDVHIDDGGNLICRYGSNEGVVDGIAKVICPLEIESERKKWEKFLAAETNAKA
ncbi:M20 family metallo-hydrolase [Candidatus Bathyarchaeota archaeon]|nr:M20 family metallo-hydrolase [Candidatus Bathyarchaeota archaeon]